MTNGEFNKKRLAVVYAATCPVGAVVAVAGHYLSDGWFFAVSTVAVVLLVWFGLGWAAWPKDVSESPPEGTNRGH